MTTTDNDDIINFGVLDHSDTPRPKRGREYKRVTAEDELLLFPQLHQAIPFNDADNNPEHKD